MYLIVGSVDKNVRHILAGNIFLNMLCDNDEV